MIVKKRIWLCSLIILLGVSFLLFKKIESRRFGGLNILTADELGQIVEGKSYSAVLHNAYKLLEVSGQNIAYDEKSNTYYVSQLVSQRDLHSHFNVKNAEFEVYVEKMDGLNDVQELMRNANPVRIWVVGADVYTICDMVITGAPIISINTDEPLKNDYGSGKMVLFEPDEDAVDRLNIKSAYIIAKENMVSQTYSFKLMNKEYDKEKKIPLLSSGEYSDWKLYKVSENDGTLMRAKLASDMWNIMNNQSGLIRVYSFVEVVENNTYQGLYLLAPKWSRSTAGLGDNDAIIKIEDTGENFAQISEDADSLSDYIMFVQFVYAYDNINHDCSYIERKLSDGSKKYQFIPDKIKYAFGCFSNSLDYLTWQSQSNVIFAAGDFGMSEEYWENDIYIACAEKWKRFRDSIDAEDVKAIMSEYKNYVTSTGLVKRYVKNDAFGYYYDRLETYVTERIGFLDNYYSYMME